MNPEPLNFNDPKYVQSIITGPTGDAKIDSLRASIIGPEAATVLRHQEDTAELTPLPKIDKPLAVDRLVGVLKKKQVPFVLIYITDTPDGRHAHFENTIENPQGADLIHSIVEANRLAFWPDGSTILGEKGGKAP